MLHIIHSSTHCGILQLSFYSISPLCVFRCLKICLRPAELTLKAAFCSNWRAAVSCDNWETYRLNPTHRNGCHYDEPTTVEEEDEGLVAESSANYSVIFMPHWGTSCGNMFNCFRSSQFNTLYHYHLVGLSYKIGCNAAYLACLDKSEPAECSFARVLLKKKHQWNMCVLQ